MDVFETLRNEKFFNPLTGINKRIYFECITELIEYSKSTPVLYETNVRDLLEIHLSNKQYHVKNDDTDFDYNDRDSVKIIRNLENVDGYQNQNLEGMVSILQISLLTVEE